MTKAEYEEEQLAKYGPIAEKIGQMNAEIERLKQAVKSAFIDGHLTANLHGYYDVKPLQSQNEALSAWDKSQAKKVVEGTQ